KIEVLLEMQNKKLLGELEGIKQELQDLKDQVSSIKRMQASAPAAAPQSEVPATEPAPPAPESKPIDRNNVAPSDVSIEKVFYFGTK
ncbi:hypothetical protein GOV07_05845, partial [Candidatus Woesearchaeota archaeon]|nr:hypothetical protein [Candidatus Woesearchaeota archaeon]